LTAITGGIEMTDPVTRAVDPDQSAEVSRDMLAQMDEAATNKQHWKILITSGMGFFTCSPSASRRWPAPSSACG
jgi:hypothetical protein